METKWKPAHHMVPNELWDHILGLLGIPIVSHMTGMNITFSCKGPAYVRVCYLVKGQGGRGDEFEDGDNETIRKTFEVREKGRTKKFSELAEGECFLWQGERYVKRRGGYRNARGATAGRLCSFAPHSEVEPIDEGESIKNDE